MCRFLPHLGTHMHSSAAPTCSHPAHSFVPGLPTCRPTFAPSPRLSSWHQNPNVFHPGTQLYPPTGCHPSSPSKPALQTHQGQAYHHPLPFTLMSRSTPRPNSQLLLSPALASMSTLGTSGWDLGGLRGRREEQLDEISRGQTEIRSRVLPTLRMRRGLGARESSVSVRMSMRRWRWLVSTGSRILL